MIFLTVGTEYPFDRLVRAIDDMIAQGELFDDVFAQIGYGGYRPKYMNWSEMMPRTDYETQVNECRGVISHAGMGTIISCIEQEKPLLVMPRRAAYGELVSDHQIGSARKFFERGDILLASDEKELSARLLEFKNFTPSRQSSGTSKIIEQIELFLESVDRQLV
jgi:UDP-N-acetylglucosamine transferase subunit ALG13